MSADAYAVHMPAFFITSDFRAGGETVVEIDGERHTLTGVEDEDGVDVTLYWDGGSHTCWHGAIIGLVAEWQEVGDE